MSRLTDTIVPSMEAETQLPSSLLPSTGASWMIFDLCEPVSATLPAPYTDVNDARLLRREAQWEELLQGLRGGRAEEIENPDAQGRVYEAEELCAAFWRTMAFFDTEVA